MMQRVLCWVWQHAHRDTVQENVLFYSCFWLWDALLEQQWVSLINLKCRIYYLHNIFPKSKSLFSVSWQSVLLCADNQQERAALALFISLHSFSLYNSSFYFSSFPPIPIFLIWNLSTHMLSVLFPLPICCFLIFVRARPGAYSNLPAPH